jgi:hypothetical protein
LGLSEAGAGGKERENIMQTKDKMSYAYVLNILSPYLRQ